jgi:hypothetical protein
MVAGRNDVHTGGKELGGYVGSKAEPSGGVFSVDYDKIGVVFLDKAFEADKKRSASGLTYDVAEDESAYIISHASRL